MSLPRSAKAAWSTARRAVAAIQKLIACDLDGTLLDSHSLITEETIAGLSAALVPGMEFTICSGREQFSIMRFVEQLGICLLYTSDAADDLLCVDLGGRRIIKKKKKNKKSI